MIRLLVLLLVALCVTVPLHAAQFQEIDPDTFPSAAGAAWGDYDGDGYPDLFLAGGTAGTAVPVPHGPLLYHNNHDLTFTDVSQFVGLSADPVAQWGVAWGDYNNDGKLDVLVGASDYPALYEWNGTQFSEVGQAAGFHVTFSSSYSQNWGDYNGDNLLDAFCSNIFGPGYLMKNSGDGTFTEVSAAAGMAGNALNDQAMSAAWGDFDNDGKPDLVLARQSKSTKLYRNNGDGTFTDVSDQSGLSAAVDAQSVIWGDYDNDGWLDLYITAGPYTAPHAHWLFHNNGDGTFTDVSATAGLSGATDTGGGAVWVDYDNDGFLDLYVGNWWVNPYLYHNNGDGTFTNMVIGSGLEVGHEFQSGAAAAADIDLDGRMDILQATFATDASHNRCRLYHNVGPAGNWLRVKALTSGTGDATDTSKPTRDAIGARVELNLDNDATFPLSGKRTLTRLVDGGSGWLGQNEQVAQFGLGASSLVAVRVKFPDGSVVVHRGVAANQQITLRDVPAGRQEIFTDVPLDYYAYPEILAVKASGIAGGYPDGTYRPSDPVSRDQMAAYISRAIAGGDAKIVTAPAQASFTDVPTDYWAFKYVEYAKAAKIVGGYPDGLYHPTDPVDRGQMAIFIARSIVNPTGDEGLASYTPPTNPTFPDVATDYYAYKYIEYIKSKSITGGYPDGTYHPADVVTRDQMAVYVARAFALE